MEDRTDLRYTSRFAKYEDILTPEFKEINERLTAINKEHININHDELNKQRFNWFDKLETSNSYYGTRYWEYPFAIMAADLKPGIKVADIGCGTTPFTPYLSELVGKDNVTGIDEQLITDDSEESHFNFGTRSRVVDHFGFNFKKTSNNKIEVEDASFDVVFCLSVLEHIRDHHDKQSLILELVRILKPGGKLILTFDTAINAPLNDPLKIIAYSGLIPSKHLDLRWPEKRFIRYENNSFDVFGLILLIDDNKVYLDQKESKKAPLYTTYEKYLKTTTDFNISYSKLLMIRDMKGFLGPFKVFIKKNLRRY